MITPAENMQFRPGGLRPDRNALETPISGGKKPGLAGHHAAGGGGI